MRTMTFKVDEEDARILRGRARQARLTLSEYLRRRLLEPVGAPTPVGRVKCPHTGAVVFAPMPSGTRLTTASAREMLSDFP